MPWPDQVSSRNADPGTRAWEPPSGAAGRAAGSVLVLGSIMARPGPCFSSPPSTAETSSDRCSASRPRAASRWVQASSQRANAAGLRLSHPRGRPGPSGEPTRATQVMMLGRPGPLLVLGAHEDVIGRVAQVRGRSEAAEPTLRRSGAWPAAAISFARNRRRRGPGPSQLCTRRSEAPAVPRWASSTGPAIAAL